MKILDDGHLFALDCLDGDVDAQLRFVKRVGEKYPGNDAPAYSGTTSQEVIRALIARTLYVNNQDPDPRNQVALRGFRMALRAFEVRAAERRGELEQFFNIVDSGAIRHPSGTPLYIEEFGTCKTCGHIACGQHL